MAQTTPNKNAKTSIAVKGNCGMCKKRIEKAAYSVAGVKMALWSEESKTLKLWYNENKCQLAQIEKSIAKAGHDTENHKAKKEDYDNLHGCCQYDRNEG